MENTYIKNNNKEDENITTNKRNDKPIKSKNLDLNNDILGKKNECLSIPICININDEEVEISVFIIYYIDIFF